MSQRRSTQRRSGGSQRTQERDDSVEGASLDGHLVGRVIRYLLAADRQKYAIRGAHIKKMALPNNVKDFRLVMSKAKDALNNIFGYQLIEMKGQRYFLVNKFQNEDIQPTTSEKRAEKVLLFLTLTYIFMRTDNEGKAIARESMIKIILICSKHILIVFKIIFKR